MKKDYLEPETLLKLLTKHSPDMIWIKDLNNCYLYANDFMCKNFLNATQEELIGKNDVFFASREINSHPENPNWFNFGEICMASDFEVLSQQKPVRFTESGYVAGEFKCLEVDKAPFYDENGNLIGTIGVGRDMTSETILEQKNEKLMYFYQLTELPNRQKIIKDIEYEKPNSCIVFNIDDFKEINDFFGTQNADKILKDVASRFINITTIPIE